MGDDQGSDGTHLRPGTEDAYKRNRDIGAPTPDEQLKKTTQGVRGVLECHIGGERGGLKRRFYNGGLGANHIDQATKMSTELRTKGCSNELALSFSILGLYDLVILIG